MSVAANHPLTANEPRNLRRLMNPALHLAPLLLYLTLAAPAPASAQAPDSAALLAAQREAMAALAPMDGLWRGSARVTLPGGRQHELIQTERVGAMLGDTVKVIEGRGFGPEDRLEFNALAVVSFAPATGRYRMHSYAQGMEGDFEFEPRADGFAWTMRFGPVAVRHVAVIEGDRWTETGERLVPGQPPVRTFEMTLRRIGATDWPAAGAVPAR